MDRSLYPSGVLVDSVALNRTELTKATEILRNRTSWTTGGVLSGGTVTVNAADNTRIDIAAFSGFTPSGEFVQDTSGAVSQPLADDTAVNYVLAIYSETNTGNQSHETDGYSYPTKAEADCRITIMTQASYVGLSESDSILANDAKDRSLILAIVTGNSGAALTSGSIESPTDFNNVLWTSPVELSTISGVTVRSVSSNTSTGAGTLTFDDTGLPTYSLTWASNGAVVGAATTFTTDGTYVITDGSSNTITLDVIASQLPVIGGSTTETITVYDLYEQDIPRISAEDNLHRNYTGTGIVTTENPHGLSFDDLYGSTSGTLQEHQDVQHCNGIWKESSSSTLNSSISVPSAVVDDILNVSFPGSNNIYYINGKKLNSLSNTSVNFDSATYGTGCDLYEAYVDDDTVLRVYKRASYPNPRTVTGTWLLNMSKNHTAGSYNLVYTVGAGTVSFSWDSGPTSTIDTPLGAGDPEGIVLRLFSQDGINWVDLYVNRSGSGPADAQLPVGSHTDSITVQDPLTYDQNMVISSFPYWYDSVKGSIGYRTDFSSYPLDTSRILIDKRPWGNLCETQISDETLEDLIYSSNSEFNYSGIVFRRESRSSFGLSSNTPAALDVTIKGGYFYCRGKRDSIETSYVSLADSKTHLVYIAYGGTLSSLNITDDFGASTTEALSYVLGLSTKRPLATDSPFVSDDTIHSEKGVPLFVVTTSGGVVSDYYDVSRNVNRVSDYWSVASRYYSVATNYEAAFDNLSAAVHYIDVYRDYGFSKDFKLNVVGDTSVPISFTLPTGVSITSNKESTIYVYPASLTGVVKLNDNCFIDNSYFYLVPSSDSTIFGIEGDNITFRDCRLRTSSAGANVLNIFEIDRGASTTYGLTIDNCVIETSHEVFYDSTGTTNNENFSIINNSIESSSGTNHYSLFLMTLLNASEISISNNNFSRSNGNTTGDILRLVDSSKCIIDSNFFHFNDGDGSTLEKAISSNSLIDSIISNNTFTNSSTTNLSTGISLDDSINCIINYNIIKDFYMSIYLSGSSSAKNNICNNTIEGYKVGIVAEYLQSDYIEGNSMIIEDDTTVENIPYGSSLLVGIDQYASYAIVYNNGTSFNISNNSIIVSGDSGDSVNLEDTSKLILGTEVRTGVVSNNYFGFVLDGLKTTGAGSNEYPILNYFLVDIDIENTSLSVVNNIYYNNFKQGLISYSGSLYILLDGTDAGGGTYAYNSNIEVTHNDFHCTSTYKAATTPYPYDGAVGGLPEVEFSIPYELYYGHNNSLNAANYLRVSDCSISYNDFKHIRDAGSGGDSAIPRIVAYGIAGGTYNATSFNYKNVYTTGTSPKRAEWSDI